MIIAKHCTLSTKPDAYKRNFILFFISKSHKNLNKALLRSTCWTHIHAGIYVIKATKYAAGMARAFVHTRQVQQEKVIHNLTLKFVSLCRVTIFIFKY